MTASPAAVSIADGLGVITLTRPESLNAMGEDLIVTFSACVEQVTSDPSVRAILLEAEGKHFCAGGDLKAISAHQQASSFIGELARGLHASIEKLMNHNAPVVVAVNGAAAGAGLSLAVTGDVVICGTSSQFSIAYPALGLTADGGASWSLPRLIGRRLTQEMAFLGRRLNAEEALANGLVTRIVADDAVRSEARAIAEQLAKGPTAAFGAFKRLLLASSSASLHDQLEAEASSISVAMGSVDGREGVAAFLERRPAVFTGQ
jgi:2-(1,2-epoxy-1,2-dihydrophenyl)acetyl-CoA isomerase